MVSVVQREWAAKNYALTINHAAGLHISTFVNTFRKDLGCGSRGTHEQLAMVSVVQREWAAKSRVC
jgi:hypothetical protein